MPLWMLDAATCGTMRTTVMPEASASALADLHALLVVSTNARMTDEALEYAGIGFLDHHEGDRHAPPATPRATTATGLVRDEPAATGNAGMDGVAGPDATRADGARDPDAGRPRRRRGDPVGERRQ